LALPDTDPFRGTWKLKSHSSQPALPPPSSWIHHIQTTAETIHAREEIVSATGERTTIAVHARFDGLDYPVSGSPQVDAMAYKRDNERRISGIGKKGKKTLWSETATVSADGQTLTIKIASQAKTSAGFEITVVFEKLPSNS